MNFEQKDAGTDGWVDRVIPIYPSKTLFAGGIKIENNEIDGELTHCFSLGMQAYIRKVFKVILW